MKYASGEVSLFGLRVNNNQRKHSSQLGETAFLASHTSSDEEVRTGGRRLREGPGYIDDYIEEVPLDIDIERIAGDYLRQGRETRATLIEAEH
ncbi:hypothetical protein Trydic_g20514 [Trypoxylus dichotomus]